MSVSRSRARATARTTEFDKFFLYIKEFTAMQLLCRRIFLSGCGKIFLRI